MPVFIILLFIGAGFLWLLLSGAYKAIGKFMGKLIGDAKDAIEEEDPDNDDDHNENQTEDGGNEK